MTHKYRADVDQVMVYPTLGITVSPGDVVDLDIEPDEDNPIAGLTPVGSAEPAKPKERASKKQDADGSDKPAESQE